MYVCVQVLFFYKEERKKKKLCDVKKVDCKSINQRFEKEKKSSQGARSAPLSEGRKYSFVKQIWLLHQKILFLSVCTDTVGQLCGVAILQTTFLRAGVWSVYIFSIFAS